MTQSASSPAPPAAPPPRPKSLIVLNNISKELDKRKGEEQGITTTRRQRVTQFLSRYGAGMVLGFVVVDWSASKVKQVPLVGPAAGQVLNALKVVIGPALGAAAVYGIVHREEGVHGARQRVAEGAAYMSTVANTRIKDAQTQLKRELPKLQARSKEGAKRMADGMNEGARALGESAKEGAKLIGEGAKEGVKRLTTAVREGAGSGSER